MPKAKCFTFKKRTERLIEEYTSLNTHGHRHIHCVRKGMIYKEQFNYKT